MKLLKAKFRNRRVCTFAHPGDREKGRGVSETKPGQALSVEELFRRHLQGLAPPIGRESVEYAGDVHFDSLDLEEVERMDITERSELRGQLRQDLDLVEIAMKKDADAAAALKAKEGVSDDEEPAIEEEVKPDKPKKPKRPASSTND